MDVTARKIMENFQVSRSDVKQQLVLMRVLVRDTDFRTFRFRLLGGCNPISCFWENRGEERGVLVSILLFVN